MPLASRYKVGDKVAVFKLGRRFLGVGWVKEIRGNPRFNERRLYIIQLPDRIRRCYANELRLIKRT